MHSQRFSLGVAGVLAASLFSLTAHANSAGITGRSGKQGMTCMDSTCHGGNPSAAIPVVQLTGPTSLAAGETGTYSLVITGGPAVKAGMNVAVSNNGGTLNKLGTDLQVAAGELTHTAPKPFANGEARFDFSLVAPSSSRTVTLYASGNSVNGDANNTLDHSASTTLDIQVTGSSTPDAGTPDAGTDNPPPPDNNDKGGCAAAGGAPMALLLAVVAERLRRRRTA
ncbi:MAG: MXAN_6652 family MXYO-CTERM-anchored protein [Hyalangium sp.]|uniref:MXAN_6652 family MXYO-CTERM-anchored protein n=1 Tax=Hyalangium sp. TaxID=2028555 RepID=UPI003899A837